jgi:hypothetical protein
VPVDHRLTISEAFHLSNTDYSSIVTSLVALLLVQVLIPKVCRVKAAW